MSTNQIDLTKQRYLKLIDLETLKRHISEQTTYITGLRGFKNLFKETLNNYRYSIYRIIDSQNTLYITTDELSKLPFAIWHKLDTSATTSESPSESPNKDTNRYTDLPNTLKYICVFKNKKNEYLTNAELYYDTYEACFVAENKETNETLYDVTHWKYIDEIY